MDKKFRHYTYTTTVIQKSGFYYLDDLCNGFTVTNVGDTPFLFNDQTFYPGTVGTSLGDSRSFGGNEGEICRVPLKVAFSVPPGTAPALELVQKVYIDTKENGKP